MRVTRISPLSFKPDCGARGMLQSMNSLGLTVYSLSLVVLFAKFFLTISVQAQQRIRHRRFRYAEDAAFFRGNVGDDSELCVRAQQVLRNDTESQIYYLALGGIYLLVDAWPVAGPYYFALYACSRIAHTYFLLTGRQPHRNRVFAVGIAVLFALAGHIVYARA
jgi:hypothetical protein